MGAELNAGTGKESTSVYARVIDEHLPEAFDVMADMVFRPSLDDIDSERAVILEEIAMYEDDPRRRCSTYSARRCSATIRSGRAIIGRAPVIADTPADEIARFHARATCRRTWSSRRPGAIDHEAIVALARERTEFRRESGVHRAAPSTPRSCTVRRRFERKDTEQFHVCLGGVGDLPPR